MHKTKRNILNWILVTMMVVLPLRGVQALDHSNCQMHDEASRVVNVHSMHMMSEATQVNTIDLHNCCDNSDVKCNSDCGIGTAVSFITQPAITLPALNETSFLAHVNNDLVFRDLAPPIRPPANL